MPLRQLYPDTHSGDETTCSAPAKVDIFAVHGLNPRSKKDVDHAWDTWRTPPGPGGRLWLRDDLPQHIPNSRIFLYQYNSTAVLGRDRTTFIDKANDLLEAIRAEREEDDDDEVLQREGTEPRPILFLGHSLGGLLIKQALVNAHNNPKYAPIKLATKGIAFFATPHNGGNRMLVGIGGIAARIAIDLGFQKGDNIIEMLRDGGLFSDMMQELWRQQLLTYKIVTFWGALDGIVPRESARLNLPGDRENVVTLAADHRSICKFGTTETDQDNFKLVRTNLKDLYKTAIQRRDGGAIVTAVPRWLFDRDLGDASKSEADYHHCPADHSIRAEFLRGFTNTSPFLTWADRAGSLLWCQLAPGALAVHKTIAGCIIRHASSSNIYPLPKQCPGNKAVKILYYKCSTTQTAPVPKIYAEGLEEPETDSTVSQPSDEDESRMFAPELMLRSFIAQTITKESSLLQDYMMVIAGNAGQKAFETLRPVFGVLVRRYKGRVVLVVDDLHHVQFRTDELLETLTELTRDGDSPSNCSVLLGGDPNSAILSETLRGIPAVGSTSEYEECLRSLLVESGHTRRDEILAPVHGTNEWIWDHPRFKSWTEDARGALAIVGKPGSGKSVLAKHIMAMLRAQADGQNLPCPGSEGSILLSAWFYSERSGEQFTRHESLLRSFLHEFLTRDVQLFDLCKTVYRKAPPAPLRTWTTDEMQTLLRAFAGSNRPFLMVIDAVDEATDDSILRLVEDMSQLPGSRMKFIVLTRPVRLLDRKFWSSRNITLQSENEEDIRKVVFQRCAALRRHMHDNDDMDLDSDSATSDADGDWDDEAPALHSAATSLETLELQKLCDTIIKRADGVMLWVILVFDSLSRMLAREGFLLLSEIRERALQLPTGLSEFYTRFVQDLQTRLDENGLLKVRRVLMWISAASEVRPFTLGELYDALAIPNDQDATQLQDLQSSPFNPLERNRIPASSWAERRRILQNLCGPFIDIIRVTDSSDGKAPNTTADSASSIVQLVHQTVKDFLMHSADAGSLRFGPEDAASMVRTSAIQYIKLMLPLACCAYAPIPFESKTGWDDNMDAVLAYLEQLRLIPFCSVLATRDASMLAEIQRVAQLAILHGFLIFPTPQTSHETMDAQSDDFVSTVMAKFFRVATLRGMVGAARAMLSLSRLVKNWWNTDGHTVRLATLFIVFERVTHHSGNVADHENGFSWQALADASVRKVVSEVVKWRVDGDDSGEPDVSDVAQPLQLSGGRTPPRLERTQQRKVSYVDEATTTATKLLFYVWPLAAKVRTLRAGGGAVLPLRTFIQESLRRSRSTFSTLNLALYYIAILKINTLDRIKVGERPFDLRILEVDLEVIWEPRRMFVAALMVAHKYLQDRTYSNRAWSKISGLAMDELHANEQALLRGIGWNVHVPAERYEWWMQISGACSFGTWTEDMLTP